MTKLPAPTLAEGLHAQNENGEPFNRLIACSRGGILSLKTYLYAEFPDIKSRTFANPPTVHAAHHHQRRHHLGIRDSH